MNKKNYLVASIALALAISACGGDTYTYGDDNTTFNGGDVIINDSDTTIITYSSTQTPTVVTTTVTPSIDAERQMSCKYDIELRPYWDPFTRTQVRPGDWSRFFDGKIEVVCAGRRWFIDELSIEMLSIGMPNVVMPVENPRLYMNNTSTLQNVQYGENRVAVWTFPGGYEITDTDDGLWLSIENEVRADAELGFYSFRIRSLLIRDENGNGARINLEYFNPHAQIEVTDVIGGPICNDGYNYCGMGTQWDSASSRCVTTVTNVPGNTYCGTDTAWDGFTCVSTVVNVPGNTYCGNSTVWNPASGDCIASIPPPPPQPLLPIAVYGLPTNSGNEVHRGDSFTIHQHLVGTIPAGSTVGLQIRLNGVAQSDLNGPVQVYVNDQSQQQGLTPIPFNGNQILYFWYTTQVPSTLLNIRLVVPTAVSMPTGSYTVEVLTAEVTLPNSTFASVNMYGQQSNIVVSN